MVNLVGLRLRAGAGIILKTCCFLLLPLCAWAQQYTISTFAGTGAPGSTGNGASAVNADLSAPVAVLVGPAGIYIVDNGNEEIRLVSGGNITLVAGDGGQGYEGDGEAATHAQLNSPAAAALDSSGNIYIADSGNAVIRMIAPDGTITTVAGFTCLEGQTTACGEGYAGDGGPATSAQLDNPLGVAVDSSGNLYISDSNNNVIRKVSGGVINTIRTNIPLQHPAAIAFDPYDNLFIADTSNNRIVELSPSGAATVVAGGTFGYSGDGGPATQAQLEFPTGVTVDGAGNIYIADKTNCVIRKVSGSGIISTIAGNGSIGYSGEGVATNVELNFPSGVAVDAYGNLYVADTGNNRVRLLQAPAPAISTGGVVNGASFAAPLSPGEIASVFGTSFGVYAEGASSVPLPTSLNAVTVTVGGRQAPLFYAGPTQINFQVPWETPVGTSDVAVSLNGVTSATATVPVVAASPGLFTSAGNAVVQNSDYTVNQASNPAAVGSAIICYLTGSGPVSDAPADGAASPSSPLVKATSTVTATIGTQPAQVLFAGLAPDFVGVLQVNVTVPSGLAAGTYPLTITVGGKASNSASVYVR
jgi:uncharacterized protein (TIGR03437 family)